MSSTFVCECCSFSSTKKSHYTEHLASKKHLAKIQGSAPAPIAVPSPVIQVNDNTVLLEKIKMLEMIIEQKDVMIKMLQDNSSEEIVLAFQTPIEGYDTERITAKRFIALN